MLLRKQGIIGLEALLTLVVYLLSALPKDIYFCLSAAIGLQVS